MRTSTRVVCDQVVIKILVLAVVWILADPTLSNAQQGQNAVYNSSGTTTNSSDFIDASAFGSTGTNICSVLHTILNPSGGILPSGGGVIDARGLPGTTGTSMTCTASPWSGITNPPPTIILLPATGANPIFDLDRRLQIG